jgi:HSP20 family protein
LLEAFHLAQRIERVERVGQERVREVGMASVAVEKGNGERRTRAPLARSPERENEGKERWDPFRSVRELVQWDRGERLLAPLWERVSSSFSPAFDLRETKEAFEFKADVPGVDAKDLEVRLTHDRLTISGRRVAEKTEHGDAYHTFERAHGSFIRRFKVPSGTDPEGVQARLKDGVLRVLLPKKAEDKPRHVQIKSA